MVGECRINLDVIDRNKIELFLFSEERETAIVEVTMSLDQRGTCYVPPEKHAKKLFLKFHIKEAELLVDTEVFGSMKPAVKIKIGEKTHETNNAKGKHPSWTQTVVFENVEQKDHITFTIVDKEMIGEDDLIGSAVTTVEALKS